MSIVKRFLEYVDVDMGNGFKGFEYFKYIVDKKGAKWIEDQVASNLIDPDKLTSQRNVTIYSHGSQYLWLNYMDKKMILRMSTHSEDRNISNNADYSINMWSNNERNIKEHINTFIDIATVYFNAIEKESSGEELTDEEEQIIRQKESRDPFHQPSSYPPLDVVHRKAMNKKQSGNSQAHAISIP